MAALGGFGEPAESHPGTSRGMAGKVMVAGSSLCSVHSLYLECLPAQEKGR